MLTNSSSLISVIIPVYNVEPYLRSCLDSVLNQTYTNIEVIIIASTSQDMSCEICNEYAKKDSRILLIPSEPNGLSDARNKGIELAKGDYLSFVDSDDFLHPDFIATLYSICVSYDCEIAQCNYCDFNGILPPNHQLDTLDVDIYSGVEMCYNLYGELYVSTVVSWGKIYKKILFGNIRYPFKKIHEDEAISHRLLYSSKRVGVTPQKLYYYRNRDDSIMGQSFSIKNLDFLDALNDRLSFFEENGESNLYALTLKVYAEWLPTYIYNVRLLSGDNGSIESYLYDVYSHIKKEALRCQSLSIYDKIHMILVWIFPRTKFTLNVLEKLRKYF